MTPVQRLPKLFRECEKFSQDDGIAWKSLVVVHAILDFSEAVQKLFPPGGPVRFALKYGGPELTGTVCKVQYPRESLPDGGLHVCV